MHTREYGINTMQVIYCKVSKDSGYRILMFVVYGENFILYKHEYLFVFFGCGYIIFVRKLMLL